MVTLLGFLNCLVSPKRVDGFFECECGAKYIIIVEGDSIEIFPFEPPEPEPQGIDI